MQNDPAQRDRPPDETRRGQIGVQGRSSSAFGHDTGPERSTYFIRRLSPLTPATPLPLEEAGRMILARRTDDLLERKLTKPEEVDGLP